MALISKNRLVSLDVFRGITIAGMVLVNNPGDWGHIYSPLAHAEWSGATPTDLIFPYFLFIVGVAIPLSLGRHLEEESKRAVYLKIFRRAALIFLIGLFMAAFPFFDFAHLRIPGVLQRIAVCYLFASLIFLNSNWKQQVTVVLFLLFYYWLLMTLVPVPGCASWSISDKTCNLAAWTDRAILGANHIWKQGIVYDPEGVLSTLPAIASCLFGVLAGSWIKTKRTVEDKTNGMLAYGLILMAVGWAWSFWMPFNKSLWTSSYVVFTGGTALCFLGVCTWLIDIKGYTKWSKPFVVFGTNALVLFVGSGLVAKLMGIIKFENAAGKKVAIKTIIYKNLFVPLFDPYNASLAFALVFILISLFLIWLLYRRRIFIRL